MKSKLFSLLTLLFLGVYGFGQVKIQWQKCFGGTSYDCAYTIQQTSDGGFVFAGESMSIDGDVFGNNGESDFWTVKIDACGNLQWQKCLGGTGSEYAQSIQQTLDGGYVLAGYTNSTDGDVYGNHGGNDAWVVKLDSTGYLQWQKCLGGTNHDDVRSIQQNSDGSIIVAGRTISTDGDVSGNHGSYDFWIVKLDIYGNLQWQKCFGGISWEYAYDIQQTSDGGFVIAGFTESNSGDVFGNHGESDFWVAKIDSAGTLQWQKCMGGTDTDYAHSVKQTSDGGYIVAGKTYSTDGDVFGNHGDQDFWVVKLDIAGNLLWQKCLGGTGYDWAYSIQQTIDGNFIVAGETLSIDGDVSGNNGELDFWVVKLDISGNLQWQKCMGGTTLDWARTMMLTSDGGFILAGGTYSTDGNVTNNHGSADVWIVKFIDPNISGVVFHDHNANGVKDSSESFVAGHLLRLDPDSVYTFSNNEGGYFFKGDTGIAFTVNYLSQQYWYETTGNYQYYVVLDSVNQWDDSLDYSVSSTFNINNLSCYFIASLARVDNETHYWLTYKNWGTVTASGTIELQYDPLLTYVASTPLLPVSHVGNTLTFAYDTLGPGAQRMLRLDFQVPGVQYLGDTLHTYAMITPLVPDTFITNNYDTLEQVITGSYDPNDKSVRPEGLGIDGYVLHGERLTYTIRFQNTGTDTAFTVVIRDTLDADLDIETFLVEAYSHPVTWQLHSGNELHFTYQNINLPDSNVNEPGSHGFIRYSISPKTGLADFTQVFNTAYIFFDYNPAIVTNTELTTYVSTLTETTSVTAAETVKAYPNPSSQTIYINLPEFTRKVEIYNTSGEKVKELVPQKDVAEIGVKDLPAGLYVVRMYGSKGVITSKFIKE